MAKKEPCAKFKKSPLAPRRFKSAYMFFSTEKHKSIREEHGKKLQTTDVAKMVSQAWKDLPQHEREEWEEMARRDKRRFEVEKAMYKGPWKVPATKSRAQKDPNAPKRPMSAFLSYSNSKRAAVKASNPNVGNAEVSRILATMWKEAPEEERKAHIEKEFELRQAYKSAIAIWRQNVDKEAKAARKKREDIALKQVDSPQGSYPWQSSVENDADITSGQELAGPATPSSMERSAAIPRTPHSFATPMPVGAFSNGFSGSPSQDDADNCFPSYPPPTNLFGTPAVYGGGSALHSPVHNPGAFGGMMPSGSFSDGCFLPMSSNNNGFDQAYGSNMNQNVMVFGGYFPSNPPEQVHMTQNSVSGAMWDGQGYGSAQCHTYSYGSPGQGNNGNNY